ncbi:MAG: metal-sensing transcriptional repressor [Eubacteriales bacterium]
MQADKKKILRYLKTTKGQIEGIIKMVEDDRYCVDISTQVLAVQALLKKANNEVLRSHINNCVKEAFDEGNGEEKVDELMNIFDKYYKI